MQRLVAALDAKHVQVFAKGVSGFLVTHILSLLIIRADSSVLLT